MQNDAPAPQSAQPGPTRPAVESMSGDALARRRALIKGLGKGSAAIAVVAPIQSLAAPVFNSVLITKDNTLCTLSGQMSNVMSRTLANTVTCTGYKPTWYWKLNNGGTQPVPINWPTTKFSRFDDIFAGSGINTKLEDVLYGSGGTPNGNSYWVAAYFNALNTNAAFPYTEAEVVTQYNSPDSGNYLQFYINHLSHLG